MDVEPGVTDAQEVWGVGSGVFQLALDLHSTPVAHAQDSEASFYVEAPLL